MRRRGEISAAQAAERVGCSVMNILYLAGRGKIRSRKAGYRRFIDRASLEEHLAARFQPPADLVRAQKFLQAAVTREWAQGRRQAARAARSAA